MNKKDMKFLLFTSINHINSLITQQINFSRENDINKKIQNYLDKHLHLLYAIRALDKKAFCSKNSIKFKSLLQKSGQLNDKLCLDNLNINTPLFNLCKNWIGNSPLPQTFTNIYNLMLNKIMQNRQTNEPISVYKQINCIKKLMRLDNKLFKFRNVSQINQYILTIITDYPKLVQTLMDVPVRQHGNNIFDFIADEKNYLLKSYQNMRAKMEIKLNEHSIKAIAPYLYISKHDQIMYGMTNIIAHYKLHSQLHHQPQLQNDTENEEWILYKLNQITNQYLANLGILKIKHHDVQLTQLGKQLIRSRQTEFYWFFNNSVKYHPKVPLSKLFYQLMNNLAWVEEHPLYHNYYGIALILSIVDLRKYKELNIYHAPRINMHGNAIQNNHNHILYHTIDMGTVPMTYMIVIDLLLEKFITHSNQVSQNSTKYITHMSQIDKLASKLFED